MANPTALVLTYSNQTISGKKEFKDDTTVNKLNVTNQLTTPLSYTNDTHTNWLTVNNNAVVNNIIAESLTLTRLSKNGADTTTLVSHQGSSGGLFRFEIFPTPWRIYLTPGTYKINWAMNACRSSQTTDIHLVYQTGDQPPRNRAILNSTNTPTYTIIQTVPNVTLPGVDPYNDYVVNNYHLDPITFTASTPDFYNFGFVLFSPTGYGTNMYLNWSRIKIIQPFPLI